MMGMSSIRGRSSEASAVFALIELITDPELYKARIEELERLKAENAEVNQKASAEVAKAAEDMKAAQTMLDAAGIETLQVKRRTDQVSAREEAVVEAERNFRDSSAATKKALDAQRREIERFSAMLGEEKAVFEREKTVFENYREGAQKALDEREERIIQKEKALEEKASKLKALING